MNEIDINVGRRIQDQLCDDCALVLKDKIKKRHLLAAMTPWGIKKLFDRIERFSCEECRQMILDERFKQGENE